MSIVYSRRIREETQLDEKGGQGLRSHYILKSDTPNETRTNVLLSGYLPTYGDPHPENAFAICKKVDARKMRDAPYLWEAEAEWEAIHGHRDPREDQKEPDLRRQKWSFQFKPLPTDRFIDLAGNAFRDRAGTPFLNKPNIPIFVDEITIIDYSSTLDRDADRGYLDHCNSVEWNGVPAYEALMADIYAEEIFEFGSYWFLKKYTVLVSPRVYIDAAMTFAKLYYAGEPPDGPYQMFYGGWGIDLVQNAGPRELTGGRQVAIQDDDGIYDGQPTPLGITGQRIPINKATGKYEAPLIYLGFSTKETADFTPLLLVPPWS